MDRLFRERASAATFSTPDRWVACTCIFQCAATKNMLLRRCIRILSFARPELTTTTTAMLSHRHFTRLPAHRLPHTTRANKIGRSSFEAICQFAAGPSHFQWAPQPQDPDASLTSGIVPCVVLGIRETPFQLSIKICHHTMSDRVDSLIRMQLVPFWNADTNLIIRRTNVRPGRTTIAACCRWPRSDWSSLFLQPFLPTHSRTKARMRCSFACGSLTTMLTVSSSKPRKTSSVAGPSHFAGATGIPSLPHDDSSMIQFFWHTGSPGGPTVMKSSRGEACPPDGPGSCGTRSLCRVLPVALPYPLALFSRSRRLVVGTAGSTAPVRSRR